MESLSDPAGSDLILPSSVKDVTVRLARPDERRRWDATMAERHPLGFRGFAGRGLRYIAEYEGCWLVGDTLCRSVPAAYYQLADWEVLECMKERRGRILA